MTTARETIEQARSGTITGPPLMIMPIKSNTLIALLVGCDPIWVPSLYSLVETRVLVSNRNASGEAAS